MPVIFHNTAGNGKISILQNGKEKGSFNVNQATDSIVDLTYETGTASTAGVTKLYDSTGTNTDGTMTQAAINTALTGKAEVEHDHAIGDITGLQSSLDGKALKSHNHDSRYYTETEMDTKLAGKADTGHTHDDRYYTESEMDSKLSGKADTDHNHDDMYYTESEMDTKLNKKSDTGHKHSASDITSGTLSASRLPNIPVSKLSGTIAAANLPSYVDDVMEYNGKANFPTAGETGKIYVDTATNLTYRWGGSAYVEISPSLALGTTSSTAYRGDLGQTAYVHSQVTSGNPHKVTKSDVGLGNVDNTADANKSVKYATSAGSATSSTTASKLTTTSAGSETQPVYFANGIPVAGKYTLGDVVSRDVKNITTATNLGWASDVTGANYVPTLNTLAYWNGAYGTANKSNLAYCKQGAFGTIVTKSTSDYATADHTHKYAGSTTAGGVANSAAKLATGRTISLTGGISAAATFDGSANVSIPVSSIKESYLSWGGKNFAGSYGCIDAAMIPDLGANRFAFGSGKGVTVEYSRDSGSTWTDYGASESTKSALFSTGAGLVIGKANSTNKATSAYMLRITLDTDAIPVYTELNKFALYVSTNGSSGSYCTIDASLQSTPTTWVNFANKVTISGWSGWNIINTTAFTTYGNTPASQYGLIRFTFGCTGGSTTYNGLTIYRLMGFGGVGWTTPSNMAKYGHVYSYDASQNVTFPANVTADTFNGTATRVSGGAANTNAARHVWFSDSGTETARCYDDNFKYNPSTKLLSTNISGNAASANNVTPEWSGSLGYGDTSYLAAWNSDGSKIKAISKTAFAQASHTHSYLPLSGGTMTGNISYKGSKATNSMIRFIDNTTDVYGNGVSIGGGGLTIIGGGESATAIEGNLSVNSEKLILANDGIIDIYTNCNNGVSSATHVTIDNSGNYSGNAKTATTASNLSGFTNTTTSPTAIDSATNNGHTYVNGTSGIYGQSDGAAFVQAYSTSWVGQIYQDYRTGQIALRGKNNGTWQSWRKVLDSSNYTSYAAPASHTHSQYYDSAISRTANTVLAAPNGSAGGATFRKLVAADLPDHNHYIIKGSYTGNGGQQNPSYIGGASVRFNMMNTTINSDSSYKDFILMDTYSGPDVPYVTALGIDKAATARAFIMSGKKGGSSWDYKAELISTQNIGSQSVNYATSAGSASSATNADKLDGYHGSAGASASTYVLRDSNNYVFLNYINSNTSNSENPTISQVIVTNGSDSYYRKASLAHLKSSLGSMPASDVYAWAKASTKPSYTYSEVGAAASSHTHNYAGSSSAGGNATWANGASYANKLGYNPTEDKTTSGLFMFQKSSDSTICPDTGWWSVLRTQHPGYTNGYWQEMAYSFSSDTIKFRRNVNGTKSSWRTIAFTDSTVSAATSATTASKLGTNAGSSTQPVYFSGGVPVACSYTLGKSVPSNAVFTDTNTWRGIQNNLTSTSTSDSLSAYQGKLLKGYVDAKEPTMTHGSSRQYYYKDGYTCYLNAWDVACDNIMAQLAEAYRPVSYSAVITGWCRNSGSSTYYPFVGLIGTNGYWQGYAMTSFGGGAYVIYEPNGTDRRSSFNLLVSGSWHTGKNSY